MGDAAEELSMTIQYCLPEPRHIMAGTSIKALTHARISGDYHPGSVTTSVNWNIGLPSILYSAIGIQPFKDVFWSSAVQSGYPSRYGPGAHESNPDMHLIISVLTTGPVGPGDKIGSANVSLIMSCCRAGDGLILKPDRPATTPDVAFSYAINATSSSYAGGDLSVPNVTSTYSTHGYAGSSPSGPLRWHYVLAVLLSEPFTMALDDLGPRWNTSAYVAFDYWNPLAGGALVDASHPLVIATGQGLPSPASDSFDQRYTILAPVLPSGHVLLGELGKVATMSTQRVSDFAATAAAGFTATVTAAAAETATFAVVPPGSESGAGVVTVACAFQAAGTLTLACGAGGGACTCA